MKENVHQENLERIVRQRELREIYKDVTIEDINRQTIDEINQLAIESDAYMRHLQDIERISKNELKDDHKNELNTRIFLIQQSIYIKKINNTKMEDLTAEKVSRMKDEALKEAKEVIETGGAIPSVSVSDIEESIQKLKRAIELIKQRNSEALKVQRQMITKKIRLQKQKNKEKIRLQKQKIKEEIRLQKQKNKKADQIWDRKISFAIEVGQNIRWFFMKLLNILSGKRLLTTESDIKEAEARAQQAQRELRQQVRGTYLLIKSGKLKGLKS